MLSRQVLTHLNGGPLAGTGHHREVLAAGLLDRRPAGQAVADDIAPGSEVPLGQSRHLLLAEALDHAQPQPPRPTLDRGDDRRLARGTAAALAAEIGAVDLDPARELRLFGLARVHRPHHLALDQPRCLPLDPEPSRDLDRAKIPRSAFRQASSVPKRARNSISLTPLTERRNPSANTIPGPRKLPTRRKH